MELGFSEAKAWKLIEPFENVQGIGDRASECIYEYMSSDGTVGELEGALIKLRNDLDDYIDTLISMLRDKY